MNADAFRHIVGRFATGVTVVTTNVDGALHGMTANAFCSVSLDPTLILVCIDHRATCLRQMAAAEHFGVSVLAEDQEDLSNLFARPTEPTLGQLQGANFRLDERDVPILGGCLASLSCRVHERMSGGDHDIFLGEVLDGEVRRADATPLLYFGGAYRGVRAQ